MRPYCIFMVLLLLLVSWTLQGPLWVSTESCQFGVGVGGCLLSGLPKAEFLLFASLCTDSDPTRLIADRVYSYQLEFVDSKECLGIQVSGDVIHGSLVFYPSCILLPWLSSSLTPLILLYITSIIIQP